MYLLYDFVMKGAVENLKQFFFQTKSTKITLIYINRLNTIIIIYIHTIHTYKLYICMSIYGYP